MASRSTAMVGGGVGGTLGGPGGRALGSRSRRCPTESPTAWGLGTQGAPLQMGPSPGPLSPETPGREQEPSAGSRRPPAGCGLPRLLLFSVCFPECSESPGLGLRTGPQGSGGPGCSDHRG